MRRRVRIGRAYLDLQPHVDRARPEVIVTAGPPGAGKTTLLMAEGLLPEAARNLDADIVKELLLRDGLALGRWQDLLQTVLPDGRPLQPAELAPIVHRESVAILDVLWRRSVQLGERLGLQGTLGWVGTPAALLTALAPAGYERLTIVDVEVGQDEAIRRARTRWWAGRADPSDDLGGRFLAAASIRQRFDASGASRCAVHARALFDQSTLRPTRLLRRVHESSTAAPTDLTKP